jgi:hypothetical protein
MEKHEQGGGDEHAGVVLFVLKLLVANMSEFAQAGAAARAASSDPRRAELTKADAAPGADAPAHCPAPHPPLVGIPLSTRTLHWQGEPGECESPRCTTDPPPHGASRALSPPPSGLVGGRSVQEQLDYIMAREDQILGLLRAAEGGAATAKDSASAPSQACAAGGCCCCCCGSRWGGSGMGEGGDASPRPLGQPVLLHCRAGPKELSEPAQSVPIRPESSYRLDGSGPSPGPRARVATLASGGDDNSSKAAAVPARSAAAPAVKVAVGPTDDDTLAALAVADHLDLGSSAPASGPVRSVCKPVPRLYSGPGGGARQDAASAPGSGPVRGGAEEAGSGRWSDMHASGECMAEGGMAWPMGVSGPTPLQRAGAAVGGQCGQHPIIGHARAPTSPPNPLLSPQSDGSHSVPPARAGQKSPVVCRASTGYCAAGLSTAAAGAPREGTGVGSCRGPRDGMDKVLLRHGPDAAAPTVGSEKVRARPVGQGGGRRDSESGVVKAIPDHVSCGLAG